MIDRTTLRKYFSKKKECFLCGNEAYILATKKNVSFWNEDLTGLYKKNMNVVYCPLCNSVSED